MYSDKDDRKAMLWRKAQADMRRLAQGYDMQAASIEHLEPEQAAELRELAGLTRSQADALKKPGTE